jgi:hypothetical protein
MYIPYGTKKIPIYISEPTDPEFKNIKWTIYVECNEAWFHQERAEEDLWRLAEIMPELIDDWKKLKKNSTLNLRLTSKQRTQLELLASKNWYKNVSAYIRAKTLSEG